MGCKVNIGFIYKHGSMVCIFSCETEFKLCKPKLLNFAVPLLKKRSRGTKQRGQMGAEMINPDVEPQKYIISGMLPSSLMLHASCNASSNFLLFSISLLACMVYPFSSCWPMRGHKPGIPTQLWHLRQVMPRVDQTTGSKHTPTAYIAQLLTLHQHRANNQYRTANQI